MEVRLGDTTVHIVKMRMKIFSGRTEGDQGYTRLRLLKHTVFSGTGIKGFKREMWDGKLGL